MGCLVESRPQRFDSLVGQVSNFVWDRSSELYLMFIKAVRIALNNTGVWVCIDKSRHFGLDFLNVLLCPREAAIGASEVVDHGKSA